MMMEYALTSSVFLAYLDPGAGSLLLQLVLGGVAGAAIAFKLFWGRISSFLRLGRGRRQEESEP